MFIEWYKKHFGEQPEIVKYKVIELDEPRGSDEDDEIMKESISTLNSHPGFLHIVKKLGRQRAYLRSKLDFEKHSDLREVDFLQAGIFWCNWLNNEIKRTTLKLPQRKLDAMEEELKAFREIDASIERIGMEE